MSGSPSAKPAGKPFAKGHDPRRNPTGGVCKERAAWGQAFLNALAKKLPPDAVADILVEQVKRGRPWAIEVYLDRVMGKVVQPISGGDDDGALRIRVIREVSETRPEE